MGAEGDTGDDAVARALALLEATHQFPCEYAITVIAFNSEVITAAVRQEAEARVNLADADPATGDGSRHPMSAGGAGGSGYQARASREGKYLSHRFSVPVRAAAEVLDLYARLRAVEGVVTIM